MLEFSISSETNIATLSPKGEVSAKDFQAVGTAMDAYINEHDTVPNLVVVSKGLPHWDSFKALKEHFHLIQNHHKLIHKVAIVSDALALTVLPIFVDHFIGAKIRHFPQKNITAALKWAEDVESDHPGEVEILEGFPQDVVALRIKGIITSQDYTKNLVPLINSKMKKHDKLKLLVFIPDEFQSYSAGAAWDDLKLGVSYWTRFEKIAIITDIGWLKLSARFFAPLIPGQLILFSNADQDVAQHWIKT